MIYAYLLLIAAVARLSFWTESFGNSVDESNYMAIAEAWDHYGRIYIDAVDRKPPLLYAFYWAIGKTFGFFHLHAVHLVALLGTFGLAILADNWARRIDLTIPKGLTAFLVILTSSSLSREVLALNSELVMMFFLFPALYWLSQINFYDLRISQPLKLFVLGFFLGLACLVKQIAVLPIGFVALLLWIWAVQEKLFIVTLKRTLILLMGFATSLVALVLMMNFAGDWQAFLNWVVFENLSYIKDAEKSVTQSRTAFSLLVPLLVSLLWLGLWIGSFLSYKNHKRNPVFLVVLGASLGSLLSIYLGSRLFSHYFVPLLFFFPLLASAGFSKLQQGKWKKAILALTLLPFLFFAFFNPARDFWIRSFSATTKIHSFDRATQAKLREIANAVQARTLHGERICVWGMAGQIFLLASRGSGTRFVYTDYVSGRLAGFQSSESHPHPFAMSLFLEDLENKKPALFIDLSGSRINDYQFFPIENYPPLKDYLLTHYEKDDVVLGADLWKRKTITP